MYYVFFKLVQLGSTIPFLQEITRVLVTAQVSMPHKFKIQSERTHYQIWIAP